jgi:hypothetical protein
LSFASRRASYFSVLLATKVDDSFYSAEFDASSSVPEPVLETGEPVQDESDNREREYWTQISESEATDAIVDAIQFLPENYTMQTDEDVPVNATSSVETSLAYGLNAHKEPKEKVLRCEYSHLPYLYCHLHNLFIFDMFLLALWYRSHGAQNLLRSLGKMSSPGCDMIY